MKVKIVLEMDIKLSENDIKLSQDQLTDAVKRMVFIKKTFQINEYTYKIITPLKCEDDFGNTIYFAR